MPDETINRVGMGVELFNGADVLSTMRAINTEMRVMKELAQSVNIPKNLSGASSGASGLYQPDNEKQLRLFEDSQRRMTDSQNRESNKRIEGVGREKRAAKEAIDEVAQYQERVNQRMRRASIPINSNEVNTNVAEKFRKEALGDAVTTKATENTLKRRKAIVEVLRAQEQLDKAEQAELAKSLRGCELLNAALEKRKQLEASIARNQARPRNERGQFMTDAEIANRELRENARQRAIARPRDEQGRFMSPQEINRRENEKIVAQRLQETERAQEQRRLEAVERERQRAIGNRSSYFSADNSIQSRIASQRRAEQRAEEQRVAEMEAQAVNRAARARAFGEQQKYKDQGYAASQLFRSQNPQYGPTRSDLVDVNSTYGRKQFYSQYGPTRADFNEQQKRREVLIPNGPTRQDFIDPTLQGSITSKLIEANTKQRTALGRSIGNLDDSLQKEAKELYGSFTKLAERAELLRKEFGDVNRGRPLNQVVADMKKVSAEQDELIIKTRQLNSAQAGINGKALETTGIIPRRSGGPTGPNGPNLRDPQGLINEKGFFTSGDALGRITRNILLYEVVSRATYGLVGYIQESVKAAKTTVEFANSLRFATETANGNQQANANLVETLRPLGLSRQQSRSAVTEAARFTESRPEDIDKLTQIVTNIAAERGGGIDKSDSLIEQLRRRESKFYKRIFGKTVESIYEDEATKNVDRQTPNTPGLVIGRGVAEEFETRTQKIKKYTAAMTDAQKENAVLNYILSQGDKFEGEAARRANTLAGQLDKMSAAWLDAQEGVGLFITELKPLAGLLDSVGGKLGFLDKLRAPTLGRSGPAGTISEADLRQYAVEKTTGPRAAALDFLNNNGGAIATGGLFAGAAALFGRTQATQNLRYGKYQEVFDKNRGLPQFSGDLVAAQNDAIQQAKELKPGLIKSALTGFRRITLGFSEQMDKYATDAVTAIRAEPTTAIIATGKRTQQQIIEAQKERTAGIVTARNRGSEIGGTAGGLLGGAIGANIGLIIAEKLNAGPMTATLLTITGGIIGNLVGSGVGSAIGGAVGGSIAGSGGVGALLAGGATATIAAATVAVLAALGLGYGIGTIIERNISSSPANEERRADLELRRQEIAAAAYPEKVRERQKAVSEDRLRFRKNVYGPDDFNQVRDRGYSDAGTKLYTGAQVAQLIKDGRANLGQFVEEIIPNAQKLEGITKILADFDEARKKVIENPNLTEAQKQYQLNDLGAKKDADAIYGTSEEDIKRIEDYRAGAAKREQARLQKEKEIRENLDRQKQDAVNQQANALSKLRDAQQGSFRIVEEIGNKYANDSNPYVKLFSDGATAAERMRQQWGFLGKTTVDYFTNLERRATNRQYINLAFGTLGQKQQLENQRARERDERNGPGFSTAENLGSEVGQAAINLARVTSQSFKREIEISGGFLGLNKDFYRDPVRAAKQEIADIGGVGLIGFASGSNFRQYRSAVNAARNEVFSGLTNKQIANDPYLRDIALQTARDSRAEAFEQLQDTFKKVDIQSRDSERLTRDLSAAQRKRDDLLKAGYDPRDVGQQFDRFAISRTDGIAQKDLSFSDFEQRQAALQREAERTVQQEQEARAAVQKGLEYQQSMNNELRIIREAIIGGDVKMLVQVQNDTQARLDQEALKDANPNFRVALDQGGVKSNPYTSEFNRYGRGGNK